MSTLLVAKPENNIYDTLYDIKCHGKITDTDLITFVLRVYDIVAR